MREGGGRTSCARSTIELDYLELPHGAVLWSQGKTKVLCTASIEEGVPRWLRDSGPRLDDGRVLAAAGVDRRAQPSARRAAAGRAGARSRSSA